MKKETQLKKRAKSAFCAGDRQTNRLLQQNLHRFCRMGKCIIQCENALVACLNQKIVYFYSDFERKPGVAIIV
jgi:hypothetical protein